MARTRQKQGKKGILEGIRQDKLLDYLDNQIELFRQKNNDYPKLILMSKETKDKLFTELELEPVLNNCWYDKKDNYKNIPIEIRDIDFLKLE